MTILTNNEQNQIDTLIKITESLDTLYQKLINLEIKCQKDSAEYRKVIDYLDITKDVLKNKYQEYNLPKSTCEKFKKYLQCLLQDPTNEWSYLINSKDRVYRRVILTLKKISESEANIEQTLSEQTAKLNSYVESPNYLYMCSKEISKALEVQASLFKDLIRIFLLYLERAIIKETNPHIKGALIRFKFNNIFLDDEIEDEEILQGFAIENNLYLSSEFVFKRSKMSVGIFETLKEGLTKNIKRSQIVKLMDLTNKDYSNILNQAEATIRLCLLKSALQVSGKDSIIKEDYRFQSYLVKNASHLKNKTKSYNMIIATLAEALEEQEHINTFNPNPTYI